MRELVFWGFALALLVAAGTVVTARSLSRAAYALSGALLSTAGLYLLLTAPLLAAVQILLYTGGVLTLVVFALVVAGGEVETVRWRRPVPAFALALAVFVSLAAPAGRMVPSHAPGTLDDGTSTGLMIFRDYLVPFELLSILLLAAVFGALLLARKDRPE